MKIKFVLFARVILLLVIMASCDEKDDFTIDQDTIDRNLWIQDVMTEVYLWTDDISDYLNPSNVDNSETFFESMLYSEDHWSFISDDYFETSNMLDGISSTSGMNYRLSLMVDNYSVVGIIEYILPGTPAEELGLKRGDLFTKINNTSLNLDNYSDLINLGGTYSVTIASVQDSTVYEGDPVTITEIVNYAENPIYLDTVYYIEGKAIAYLVYNAFVADYDEIEMNEVFARFKSQNVTDLVLDLRYNSGGYVSSAVNLASLITPQSAVGSVFYSELWNDLYTNYFIDKYGADYLVTNLESQANNINLSGKFVGLISSSTASASELVLNGLEPYTDLTLIGDTTHGKYTSMIVIPDDDDNPQWAVVPIVAKSANANDVTVKGGMVPDRLLYDRPTEGYELGDIRETLLSEAINVIAGVSTKSTSLTPQNSYKKIALVKYGKPVEAFPIISDKLIDLDMMKK